jgi:hypothetical protein
MMYRARMIRSTSASADFSDCTVGLLRVDAIRANHRRHRRSDHCRCRIGIRGGRGFRRGPVNNVGRFLGRRDHVAQRIRRIGDRGLGPVAVAVAGGCAAGGALIAISRGPLRGG